MVVTDRLPKMLPRFIYVSHIRLNILVFLIIQHPIFFLYFILFACFTTPIVMINKYNIITIVYVCFNLIIHILL